MKRAILSLTLSLFCLPCLADSTTYSVQQFLAQEAQYGLTGCNTNADHGLVFATGTTPQQIAQVQSDAAAFNWNQTPPAAPNVTQFITDLNNDPMSTANNGVLILQMGVLYPFLQADLAAGNVTALQAHWANAQANYAPGGALGAWLTNDVAAMILGHAVANNIPLQVQTMNAVPAKHTAWDVPILGKYPPLYGADTKVQGLPGPFYLTGTATMIVPTMR